MFFAQFLDQRLEVMLLDGVLGRAGVAQSLETIVALDSGQFQLSLGVARLAQPFIGAQCFGDHFLDDEVRWKIFGFRSERTSAVRTTPTPL